MNNVDRDYRETEKAPWEINKVAETAAEKEARAFALFIISSKRQQREFICRAERPPSSQ